MAVDDRMPMACEQLIDTVGHSTMTGNLTHGCLIFSHLDAAGLQADNAVGSS